MTSISEKLLSVSSVRCAISQSIVAGRVQRTMMGWSNSQYPLEPSITSDIVNDAEFKDEDVKALAEGLQKFLIIWNIHAFVITLKRFKKTL